ncbi:DUF1289 domain-containing protein [Marinobacter sp. CHS3-4]|uniref:DUF1289 domain-containing protein n=1 Tax=Marinobacter sp. CHS3-4 TaxID=3045174 RepID=UPI0024B4C8AF|nr:DUF1289 domain-containing protein [Marinobacter sp. CHS3-4]MDI9245178.1 DUF1289 domain-containing protein [Marinobacter sp. CHS3-4]
MRRQDRVQSPCVSICALDEQDQCIGCHRTSDEIMSWPILTDEERREVLKLVALREEKVGI